MKPSRSFAFAAALASLISAPAFAEPVKYTLDPSHSQILFTFNHLGFSTMTGMFSGFEGTIMFDQENPADSSVEVTFPVSMMLTGWEARDQHFATADFFDPAKAETVSFKSTSIEVTGETTALITGSLSMNGVTKDVVLDATLTQVGEQPMLKKEWAGFTATTTLLRSEWGLGMFTPFIADEIPVTINIEAGKAE
ncbi:YceI family protein [Pseudogemmobacter bohemicus]|uniref:YceI family protein n=1 Tax=Pseudogemmobacter bohemicus TaxID=2250708 RepID=UPI000DD2FF79|nr:YceI family protein [Pseudogemmobacter bohemicus]